MGIIVHIYFNVHLPVICVCGFYTISCCWNLILPFLGWNTILVLKSIFGVAIVAPPVNHIFPTVLGGNGLPGYSLPGYL